MSVVDPEQVAHHLNLVGHANEYDYRRHLDAWIRATERTQVDLGAAVFRHPTLAHRTVAHCTNVIADLARQQEQRNRDREAAITAGWWTPADDEAHRRWVHALGWVRTRYGTERSLAADVVEQVKATTGITPGAATARQVARTRLARRYPRLFLRYVREEQQRQALNPHRTMPVVADGRTP